MKGPSLPDPRARGIGRLHAAFSRSPNLKLASPRLALTALLLLGGCSGLGGNDGGSGLLPLNAPCSTDSDCDSAICIADQASGISFCTATCQKQEDCAEADFPKGCCLPTQNQRIKVCGPKQFCSQGTQPLAEPCPKHDECSRGLTCLFSEDNVINFCSNPCSKDADCGGIEQFCCRPLSDGSSWCVISNSCTAPTSSSSGSRGSTSGGTGSTGATGSTGGSGSTGTTGGLPTDDGGAAWSELRIDGARLAVSNTVDGIATPTSSLLSAPVLGRNLQLSLPLGLLPGLYGCTDGGLPPRMDGGLFLEGYFSTATGESPGFADRLPLSWKDMTAPLGCGAIAGKTGYVLEENYLRIDTHTPGRPSGSDGGSRRGKLTGRAYWRIRDLAGRVLEFDSRLDAPLEPL